MPRKDKILDVLALSFLDVDARIARLAHKWIGKPFPFAQARAVIDCYFEVGGRKAQILATRLYEEKLRQERIANDRAAHRMNAEALSLSPIRHYKVECVGERKAAQARANRWLHIAARRFGDHVKENFNEDTLALMSLLNGDVRSYKVDWVAGANEPVSSALIRSTTQIIGGTVHRRLFLLYRASGRVLVARVDSLRIDTVQDAFASQLPRELVEAAPALMADGFEFVSDLEQQQMTVTSPDGLERVVHWAGRTVDE
jgi:hypothetical protein